MNLIILDTETTGLLDEATGAPPPDGEILEIGMLAVDPRSLVELAAFATVIKPSSGFFSKLHPKVVEMHQKSGLLDELRGPRSYLKVEAGGLPERELAERWAVHFFNANGGFDGQKSPLCGYSPEFDRAWLRARMPGLHGCFSYRNHDVNFTWQSLWFATGARHVKTDAPPHRALADCRHTLAQLRRFFGLNPNPTGAP